MAIEYLKKAVRIDKEGVDKYTSCSLVWKEMGVTSSQGQRELAFDDLVPARVVREGCWAGNILDHHPQQLEER